MSWNIETPADFAELQRECIRRVEFYVKQANEKLGINLAVPPVRFIIKGATAGRAHWNGDGPGRHFISFQPTLLRENPDDFLTNTAGHEVGHLAAMAKFGIGIKPHGHEWQKTMWHLKLPATRCHNYDTSNVSSRMTIRQRPKVLTRLSDGVARPISVGRIIEFD